MSEAAEAVVEAPEAAPQPTQAQAKAALWAKHTTPAEAAPAETAPITTEAVAGTKPAAEGSGPDRKMIAPSIREFVRGQTAEEVEVDPLTQQVSELTASLESLRNPNGTAEPTPESAVLAKLQELEQREADRQAADQEAAAEETYNNQVRALKDGMTENIRAKAEDYPALIALEQFDTVFNEVVMREQAGTETSEDEVSSEVESGLWKVYETLHAIKMANTSDEPVASEPTRTLQSALSATDNSATDSGEGLSVAQRRAALWAKHTTQ